MSDSRTVLDVHRSPQNREFTLATVLRASHMARDGERPPELAKAMRMGV